VQAHAVEQWRAAQTEKYTRLTFHSDSHNDLPLLRQVHEPVAGGPGRGTAARGAARRLAGDFAAQPPPTPLTAQRAFSGRAAAVAGQHAGRVQAQWHAGQIVNVPPASRTITASAAMSRMFTLVSTNCVDAPGRQQV